MSAVHCGAQLWSTLIVNIIIYFLLPRGMLSSKKNGRHTVPSLRCFGGLRSSGKGPVKVRFSENPSNLRVDYITKQLIHGSLCNIRFVRTRPPVSWPKIEHSAFGLVLYFWPLDRGLVRTNRMLHADP